MCIQICVNNFYENIEVLIVVDKCERKLNFNTQHF